MIITFWFKFLDITTTAAGLPEILDNNTAIPEDSLLYTLSPCAFKDCMLGVSILLISNDWSPSFPIFLMRSTPKLSLQ